MKNWNLKDLKRQNKVAVVFVLALVLAFGTLAAITQPDSQPETPAMPVIEPMFMRVKHFQMDLEAAGYDPGPIDSVYGSQTDAAWKRYETDYMAQEIK